MGSRAGKLLIVAGAAVVSLAAGKFYDLPDLPPPEEYGNVLIDRLSTVSGQKPVGFFHWTHRQRYTCRVCHFELRFEMETNATEISEEENLRGEYCGACHDGETAFGHGEENCARCHSGSVAGDKKLMKSLKKFPRAPFGNQIDWVAAEERGLIHPIRSLFDPSYKPMPFKEKLEMEATWTMIPPADFSHELHLRWLDCATCHPGIFRIEKDTTEDLLMKHILEGRSCGACHLRIAFPLDDCESCHPAMN